MKCPVCDSQNVVVEKADHHYKECGLKDVTLCNVPSTNCSDCGEQTVLFGNIDQLHGLIAKSILTKKTLLLKEELRFLRSYIGYKSNMFAKILELTKEHYSRLENGGANITPQLDRLVRFAVLPKLPAPDRNYDLHDQILTEGIDSKSTSVETRFTIIKKSWEKDAKAC